MLLKQLKQEDVGVEQQSVSAGGRLHGSSVPLTKLAALSPSHALIGDKYSRVADPRMFAFKGKRAVVYVQYNTCTPPLSQGNAFQNSAHLRTVVILCARCGAETVPRLQFMAVRDTPGTRTRTCRRVITCEERGVIREYM